MRIALPMIALLVCAAGCGDTGPTKSFADAYLDYAATYKTLKPNVANGRSSFFLIDDCERKANIYGKEIKKAEGRLRLSSDDLEAIDALKGSLELAERIHKEAEANSSAHPILIEKIVNDLDRQWAVLEAAAKRDGRTADLPERHVMGPDYARLFKEDVVAYSKKLDGLSKRLKPVIATAESRRFQ